MLKPNQLGTYKEERLLQYYKQYGNAVYTNLMYSQIQTKQTCSVFKYKLKPVYFVPLLIDKWNLSDTDDEN